MVSYLLPPDVCRKQLTTLNRQDCTTWLNRLRPSPVLCQDFVTSVVAPPDSSNGATPQPVSLLFLHVPDKSVATGEMRAFRVSLAHNYRSGYPWVKRMAARSVRVELYV